MRYCPNCGRQLISETNFCPNCGTNISAIRTRNPQANFPADSYTPDRGVFEKFFTIKGRLNPARYVLRISIIYTFYSVIEVLLTFLDLPAFITFLILIAPAISMLTLTIRRLHDMGHSGWYMLVAWIPLLAGLAEFLTQQISWRDNFGNYRTINRFEGKSGGKILLCLVLAAVFTTFYYSFKAGTIGENPYGANPLEGIAKRPLEDNSILAAISKIEEGQNPARAALVSVLVSVVALSLVGCIELQMPDDDLPILSPLDIYRKGGYDFDDSEEISPPLNTKITYTK